MVLVGFGIFPVLDLLRMVFDERKAARVLYVRGATRQHSACNVLGGYIARTRPGDIGMSVDDDLHATYWYLQSMHGIEADVIKCFYTSLLHSEPSISLLPA